MNRELALLGDVSDRDKQRVPDKLVAQCDNYRRAVSLCIESSHLTRDQVASRLGMTAASLATILNRGGSEKRKRYLDPDLFGEIQDMCGNTAISQYFAMESECKLNRQNRHVMTAQERETAELQEQLAMALSQLQQIQQRISA